MESGHFQNLFSPREIGRMRVKNRIVFAAHTTGHWPLDQGPNERARAYYAARAEGGVGMIIIPQNFPLPPTSEDAAIALRNENALAAYQALSELVHRHGVKILAQLDHPGVRGNVSYYGGSALAASPVPFPIEQFPPQFSSEIPCEMELEEIARLIECYAHTAARVQRTGFDGIEISATVGSGALLLSFLSPYYNKRTDEYGGSQAGRLRVLKEILAATRKRVGSDFAIGMRLAGDELLDGGITLDEAKSLAVQLESTGHLDYLAVSPGVAGHTPPMYFPLGAFVHLAAGLKEVVSLPVICHGRITDPALAERIISERQADFVGIVRGLICDPDWPKKAAGGRLDEIRRCVGCNQACIGYEVKGLPVSCAFNPEAGREKAMSLVSATRKRKVIVVGGGVAGLEAARVAALRGHRVVLMEKERELGGQLTLASRLPGRLDFAEVPKYYANQLKRFGVRVDLKTVATADTIMKETPDAVVLATGSTLRVPTFRGTGAGVVGIRDVLSEKAIVGLDVLVVADEQHDQALGLADYLACRQRKVRVVTSALYAGGQLDPTTHSVIYSRLLKQGVEIIPMAAIQAITSRGVVISNLVTRKETLLEGVETIVYAAVGESDKALYREIKGHVAAIYRVGHCVSPRKIQHSVWDAARVARAL